MGGTHAGALDAGSLLGSVACSGATNGALEKAHASFANNLHAVLCAGVHARPARRQFTVANVPQLDEEDAEDTAGTERPKCKASTVAGSKPARERKS